MKRYNLAAVVVTVGLNLLQLSTAIAQDLGQERFFGGSNYKDQHGNVGNLDKDFCPIPNNFLYRQEEKDEMTVYDFQFNVLREIEQAGYKLDKLEGSDNIYFYVIQHEGLTWCGTFQVR